MQPCPGPPGAGTPSSPTRVRSRTSSRPGTGPGRTLGPAAGWPASLRTTVGMLLRSRFPMNLTWGPQRLMLYNDPFVATLGAKHPVALGARPGHRVRRGLGPARTGARRRAHHRQVDLRRGRAPGHRPGPRPGGGLLHLVLLQGRRRRGRPGRRAGGAGRDHRQRRGGSPARPAQPAGDRVLGGHHARAGGDGDPRHPGRGGGGPGGRVLLPPPETPHRPRTRPSGTTACSGARPRPRCSTGPPPGPPRCSRSSAPTTTAPRSS